MLSRPRDAELQVFPRSRRALWLWALVAALLIGFGLIALRAARPHDDRGPVSPGIGETRHTR